MTSRPCSQAFSEIMVRTVPLKSTVVLDFFGAKAGELLAWHGRPVLLECTKERLRNDSVFDRRSCTQSLV